MNASHYSLSGEWRPQMHNPSPLAANLSSIFTIANCSACVDSIPTLSSFAFRRQEPKPTGNSLQNNLLIHTAWSKLQKFSSMDKLVHKTCCITSSNFSGQIEGFLFGGGGGGGGRRILRASPDWPLVAKTDEGIYKRFHSFLKTLALAYRPGIWWRQFAHSFQHTMFLLLTLRAPSSIARFSRLIRVLLHKKIIVSDK